MAVPTITSLSPTSGPTQGRTLVAITGTNFRQYPAIPATGRVPVPDPSVVVLFGTEEATEVQIESATKVWCLAPVGDPGAVSVTVKNVDEDGDVVVGETVTAAAAYTYIRPYIRVPSTATTVDGYRSDLQRLVIQILKEFKRQVLENTVLKKPNKDFASVPATGKVRLASLPGIVLFGPRLSVNRFLTEQQHENSVYGADQFKSRRQVESRDVAFSFTAVTDSHFEALNIIETLDRFFDKNQKVRLLKNPLNMALGYAEYDLVYTDIASISNDIDGDNQIVVDGGFFVRGFEMQTTAGFVDDAVEFIGNTVAAVQTPSETYDGEDED
jgi:hypothetical protein